MREAAKKLWQGLGVGMLAAILAGGLWRSGILDGLEGKTWDYRARLLAKPSEATDQIRLILLDQNSLDWGAREQGLSWPWPREVYAPLIAFCRRQGARAIAFDMLYTEPSKYGVADDAAFGNAAGAQSNFVATVFLGKETGSFTNWPAEIQSPLQKVRLTATAAWWEAASLPRAAFPVPELATNAAVLANVYANPDADGIYRRIRPFQIFDGKFIPALGIGALMAAEPDLNVSIEEKTLYLGRRALPLDQRGQVILRYRGPSQTHRAYSAAAVIESELLAQSGQPTSIPQDAFKDCYVFLGCSAPGLFDLRPTPVSGVYPGVEIHATLLDNILSGDLMRDTPPLANAGLVALLAIGCALVLRYGKTARHNLLAIIASLALPAGFCLLAYRAGFWLPFLPQQTAVIFALTGGLLVNYATEGRQKRFIRSAFRQYLSEAVINQLVADPGRLTLGGEQRTLSIFFSDLQGFTTISEKLSPRDLTSLLNEYLSAMTDIIQASGGTVDKYEGDAIIAFWNAPLAQDDHAERAVRAALQCQAQLAAMRADLESRFGSKLFMRIGLNTGPVVVGNMGSRNRFNYTILGDAANLAARLEGINKLFHSFTLMSEATHFATQNAPDIAARELGLVAVVGRAAPVRVFEPMPKAEFETRRADLEKFAMALRKFQAGDFAAAAALFEALQPRDNSAAAYRKKCSELLQHPPQNWQGVWVAESK